MGHTGKEAIERPKAGNSQCVADGEKPKERAGNKEVVMSYVNQKTLKLEKRRPSVKFITPEEAIAQANQVVDKANDQIAKMMAHSQAWEAVAAGLYEENEQLRQRLTALEVERDSLLAENARLSRKVTKKQGKRKGQEWDE